MSWGGVQTTQIQQVLNAVGVPDATVYVEGVRVVAVDKSNNVIDSGIFNTNDSTVVQSAVDSLTGGGILLIKKAASAYKFATTITISHDKTVVRGEGLQTIITPDAGVDAFTVSANDVLIESLYVLHQTNGTGKGVEVPAAKDRLTVRDNRFDNCYYAIHTVNNCNDLNIENNYLSACGRNSAAIFIINSSGIVAHRIRIARNNIVSAATHAVEIFSSAASGQNNEDVQVIDNFIDDPANAGIFVANVKGCLVRGNKVYSAGSEGIDVEYCTDVIISQNETEESALQSISLFDLTGSGGGGNTNIIIADNKCHQAPASTSKCIYVQSAVRLVIKGNVVETYNDAIYLTGTHADAVIEGNNLTRLSPTSNIGINVDLGGGKTGDNLIIIGNRANGFGFGISFGSGTITDVVTIGNDLQDCTTPINTNVTPSNWIRRNNQGYTTEKNSLSSAFAIDAAAVVTVTMAHGLKITPALEDVAPALVKVTDVNDWAATVMVHSVDATNVVLKVNVTTASATVSATAKVGIRVGKA